MSISTIQHYELIKAFDESCNGENDTIKILRDMYERSVKTMKGKIKIHIEATGQDAFCKISIWPVMLSNGSSSITIHDACPKIKPFESFSEVYYLGEIREFYFEKERNMLISKDLISREDCKKLCAKINSQLESEEKPMLHNVTVKHEENKVLEQYWVMRGIKQTQNEKKVISEKEIDHVPRHSEIAQLLSDSKADFVSVVQNYRFENELPFC